MYSYNGINYSTQRKLCEDLGIKPNTFYNILKKCNSFDDAVKKSLYQTNWGSLLALCDKFCLPYINVKIFRDRHSLNNKIAVNFYRAKKKFLIKRLDFGTYFIYNDDIFVTCTCKVCGKRDILSTEQMLEHRCEV